MFTLGIVEESLKHKKILELIKPYLKKQRVETIPEDSVPIWHTNEYHVPDTEMEAMLPSLEKLIQPSWYIHAFSDEVLIVVLHGRSFHISKYRNQSWNAMLEYGKMVDVKADCLENIPLRI